MQPMAERLGVDHQGLQQFLTSSTWPVAEVRKRLARPGDRGDQPGCVGDRRHQLSTDRHRAARRGRLTASALALRRLSATLMRVAQLRIATWERRPRFVWRGSGVPERAAGDGVEDVGARRLDRDCHRGTGTNFGSRWKERAQRRAT